MKTLLIIDDDPHLLDSLRVVFAGSYHVLTALSAEEAFEILSRQPIDVILLDVVLPGMDGVSFLKTVRDQYSALPVVMISGAPSIRPVLKAIELGARDYVRKPFDIEELRLVVSRALKNANLEQRLQELEHQLADHPELDGRKPLKEAVEDYERAMIQNALRRTGGIQTRAAEELGTTRRILRYRIQKLHIES
jgi:DNA-binding NtrC family response regulator